MGGRLTKDPVSIANGKGSRFSIAVNRIYKNKEGEKVEETTYVDCVAWRRLGELVLERCEKGATVLVEGRLEIRRVEGDEGIKKYTTIVAEDIRFISSSKKTERNFNDLEDTSGELKFPEGTPKETKDALKILLGK